MREDDLSYLARKVRQISYLNLPRESIFLIDPFTPQILQSVEREEVAETDTAGTIHMICFRLQSGFNER
jgi:hypothetical protein